ncbi:hypothetical protein AL465_008865 [Bordetella pertussis 18323]|nr:hypothetical protein AL465_008865 [Bordetella pertussis 18323]
MILAPPGPNPPRPARVPVPSFPLLHPAAPRAASAAFGAARRAGARLAAAVLAAAGLWGLTLWALGAWP